MSHGKVDLPLPFLGLIKTLNYAVWEGKSAPLYHAEYKRKIRYTCQNFSTTAKKIEFNL